MKKLESKQHRLLEWVGWYKLKYRKTYETKMHKHTGNDEQLKLFIRALGEQGWKVVFIREDKERVDGGNLINTQIIIVQREVHIGRDEIFGRFNID